MEEESTHENICRSEGAESTSNDLQSVPDVSPLLTCQECHIERENDSSDTCSVDLPVTTKTYPTRFWVLFCFAAIGLHQCVQWNTWGPISESVQAAFPDWNPSTVAMMANWGTIMFVFFVIPLCWLNQRFGLRTGTLVCCGLVVVGTGLRCLPVSGTVFTVMCHLCSILVGISGIILMSSPPMLSATWFPPHERTTAMAFLVGCFQLGLVVSYLEPLMVRAPKNNVTPAEIKKDIVHLMYLDAIIAGALFVAVWLYYPTKPPLPPSTSSSVERLQFVSSMKGIAKSGKLWLLTLSYSASSGVPGAWTSVLDFSLQNFGIHEDEAMWIGVIGILVSAVGALISARFTDYVYGHIRLTLLILLTGASASYYWFYLLSCQTIAFYKWQVYASVALGMGFAYGCVPLFIELAVELAYPCPEIVVGGFLSAANNLVGIIFYFLFFIPNIGYEWVVYALIGSSSLSMIPLLFVKESYARSSIDRRTSHAESLDSSLPASPVQVTA
ncbi:solute carrier family 49 member 4-like [Oratosquilla oratoria]|uniref:solute carrier family 49 member 4-like n=1 Tax=Oratosquilla oratoria TaxID=337810 RepID=UPI003F7734C1